MATLGFVERWTNSADDCLILKPYILPSGELFSPSYDNPESNAQTVRVWVGPAIDCVRLDVMSVSMAPRPGDVATIYLEVRAPSGDMGVGFLWASGHWTINQKDPTGFLVQCEGMLTDGIEIKMATDKATWGGDQIKVGLRALVCRKGGPVGFTRGLLAP